LDARGRLAVVSIASAGWLREGWFVCLERPPFHRRLAVLRALIAAHAVRHQGAAGLNLDAHRRVIGHDLLQCPARALGNRADLSQAVDRYGAAVRLRVAHAGLE